MAKFLVDWSINGTTEIDAADKDQAKRLFEQIGRREHADNGDLEVLTGPETQEQREREWEEWKAGIGKGKKNDQPTRNTVPSSSGGDDVHPARGGAGGRG